MSRDAVKARSLGLVGRLYTDQGSLAGGGRPSAAFLVILNGLIFFALGAIGNHLLGIIFLVPTTLFYMVVSGVPQWLVRRYVERRNFLKPLPRALAYLSPLALLFLIGLVLPSAARAPNKQRPALSPDGHFEAHFGSPAPGWDIVVVDKRTGKKWKEETPFVSHLQIYWRWDADNRLWIYNSDDAGVPFLEPRAEGWALRQWGWSHRAEAGMGRLTPPPELYPEYDRVGH